MFGRNKKKRNFLERITGSVHLDDEETQDENRDDIAKDLISQKEDCDI
jgi:hypothetical protein